MSFFGRPPQPLSGLNLLVPPTTTQAKPNPFLPINQNTLFGIAGTDNMSAQPQQSTFGQLQQPQLSSPFGGLGQQQQKLALTFGTPNQQQPQPLSSSPFANLGLQQQQPQQGSIFGISNQQQQQQPQQISPFGTLGQQAQQGSNFVQPQQPQQSSPFGVLGQQAQQGSIFGQPQSNLLSDLGQQQQKPQQSSMFGLPNQQQQQPQQGATFGGLNQPQASSIFGISNQQQQQPQSETYPYLYPGLNGSTNQPQQKLLSGSLFQNVYQNSQQQGQQQGSGISQPQTRLWQQTDPSPHPRPVITQMETAFSKWNPESSNTLFQTYLYNFVPPDQAPFYSPGPQDDEGKWEEALRKKPAPGAIPVLVKGFEQLGRRVVLQNSHLQTLQGRLHEIDGGLRDLLKKHDLQISIRAAECKRKHLRLNHQCLLLAAKVQVLRNRGYAMDSAEEELREKMLKLERSVFDPTLNGRGEEIWARMVSLRERSRQLLRESDNLGNSLGQFTGQRQGEEIDEEVMKRARKILEDYGSQLSHLAKELSQIRNDFAEWEQPTTGGYGTGR